MNKLAPFIFLLLTLTACAHKPRMGYRPALSGTWTAAAATTNGRDLPADLVNSLRLTLTADRYKTQRGDQILFDGTYIIDTTVTPHHINMLGTEGPANSREALGIYSLQGNILTICYSNPGFPRPTTFASPAGSNVTLVRWHREAKANP